MQYGDILKTVTVIVIVDELYCCI